MPLYVFKCDCGLTLESIRPVADRDDTPWCEGCNKKMRRQLAAPMGRVKGRMPKDGSGGPDQFTADMLGVPLKDLPKGLKTNG